MTTRRAIRLLVGCVLVAALSGGAISCGAGQDAALVTVLSASVRPIRRLILTVSAAGRTSRVAAPATDGPSPITFPKTVSVTFPTDVGDTLTVRVNGDDGPLLIATGEVSRPIVHGGVTQVEVTLVDVSAPTDGGAGTD